VLEEHEWPIARTEYVKWYLDASPSPDPDQAHCDNRSGLTRGIPAEERSATYSAEVAPRARTGPAAAGTEEYASAPCTPGATFISEPFEEDTVLAGYSKLVAWVSSSSHDMDIFVAVRVLDQDGSEVDFCGPALIPGISTGFYPLAKGWLKVSHRVLDDERSTDFRPKHTHLRDDYAPLRAGEIVPVEIEIIPNTGLVRKGQRIRLDVQPCNGVGHGARHAYDPAYHDGAHNTIYTGPRYPSYLQLPVVPPADTPE
jgi:predicted acyl esterase